MKTSRFGRTKEEILDLIRITKKLQETQNDQELGKSEMALDLLHIELKDIEKPE